MKPLSDGKPARGGIFGMKENTMAECFRRAERQRGGWRWAGKRGARKRGAVSFETARYIERNIPQFPKC